MGIHDISAQGHRYGHGRSTILRSGGCRENWFTERLTRRGVGELSINAKSR